MIEQFLEVWKPIANQDFVYGLLQLENEIRADERARVLEELGNKVMERLDNNRNVINRSNVDSEIFGKICAYDNVMGFIQELKEQK